MKALLSPWGSGFSIGGCGCCQRTRLRRESNSQPSNQPRFDSWASGNSCVSARSFGFWKFDPERRVLQRRLPMHVGHRGAGAVILLVLLSFTLLLSACGGTAGVADSKSSSSTAPTSTSTSTGNAQTAAVLRAYRAEWSAYAHALTTANAYDSSLPATMTNPLLQRVRATLLGDHNAGVIGRGPYALHPKVASLTASTATIVDCAFSQAVLVYAKTGKQVPPVTGPENDGVRSTLVLIDGSWKVSQQSVTEGKCSDA